MFGMLKPGGCALAPDASERHTRHYCGLCKQLGDDVGQPYRGLLSHDAVFVAVLAEALAVEPSTHDSCRCPMLPVLKRPTLRAGSAPLRYAASVQLLLADQLLADREADGRRGYGAARRLIGGAVQRARGTLGALGIDLKSLEGFERTQLAVETVDATPVQAAAPTAAALARVLGEMVHLEGASHRLRSSRSRRALADLGERIGRLIYLTDALEDLREDYLEGAFNPCLEGPIGARSISLARVNEAITTVRADIAAMREALSELPIARSRDLLDAILFGELAERAHRASKRARVWAQGEGRRLLEQRRAAGLLGKAWQSVLLAMAFVAAFLSSNRAFAQKKPPTLPPRRPDAGAPKAPTPQARDAGADACPDGGADALDGGLPDGCPAPDAAGLDASIDAGPLDAGGILDAGPDAGSAGPTGAGDCFPACDALGRALKGICGLPFACLEGFASCIKAVDPRKCFEPCQGCGKSCSGCFEVCTKCADSGRGCHPDACCKGDCGKACDPHCCDGCGACCKPPSCDGCCKGCDGCGGCSGCDGCCKSADCCKGCNNCGNCGNCGGCKCNETMPTDCGSCGS